jgi:hypothetical protein
MEYEEQLAKTGALSTGLEGRVGHRSGKVGEKRRFRDACDAGYSKTAGEGPGGGKRRPNTVSKEETKVNKHKLEGFGSKEKGVLCPCEKAIRSRKLLRKKEL